MNLVAMNFLKSKSLKLFGVRVIGAVAVLLSNIVVIKYESNEVSGAFFVIYTLFQLGTILSRFGADIYLVREYYTIPKNDIQNQYSKSVAVALMFGLCLAPMLAALGYFYIATWNKLSIVADASGDYAVLLSIFCALPIFAASSVIFFIYQARHKVITQILGVNVIQPWVFLAAYLCFKLSERAGGGLTPSSGISIAFIGSVVCYAVISAVLVKKSKLELKLKQCLSYRTLRATARHQLKYATATMGTQLVGWVPYLLASYMLGPAFASVFNILQRLAMLSSFISISINSISAPHISQFASQLDFRSIHKIFWSNTKKLVCLSSGYLLLLFVVVRYYYGFPEEFKIPAYIVLVGYFINCATSVCGYYFQNASRIGALNVSLYAVAFCSPVVTYVLLESFGMIGAALAIACAVAGVNGILFPLAVLDLNRRNVSADVGRG
ncbi:Polysaccharide biosynthesis protein [compost metagenome]